jgi:ubiquinone/menaquinone biosynthesis C-methylase UbiE
LQNFPGHLLLEYPDIDMQNMNIEDARFDVLHSDTLEHIRDPHKALSECWRILKPGGACIYTIPIIVERLTRTRTELKKSFHGAKGETDESLRVWTEFGSDAWIHPMQAGFSRVEIFCLEMLAAFAFTCWR